MTKSSRQPIAALIAAALVVAATVIPRAVSATADFEFDRIFGSDRYATAAQIALDAFPGGADAVVVATGENFPDALAGGFLAGRDTGFPLLLVQKDSVPAATSQALEELGAQAVALLGGPGAISAGVQSTLDADYDVFRIQGQDRFDTARMIAETADASDIGTVDNKPTAIIASGFGFADALAAGPLSYAERFPILLTGPAGLAAPSRTALDRLAIDHVLIVGGPAVVGDPVKAEIEQMGITTERIFGADRFQTATEVADYAVEELGFDDTHIHLAKGIDPTNSAEGFADALAGAPHAGEEQAPILLTAPDQLSSATRIWIESRSDTLADGHIFGGTAAVSTTAENQAVAAARNVPGEVVRVDETDDTYTYVPDGSNEAPTVTYRAEDQFFVDGTPADFDAFEAELSVGDRVRFTATAGGQKHELFSVAQASINGRTIGNVDTSDAGGGSDVLDTAGDNEFDFINDVTGDAVRANVGYDPEGATYFSGNTQLADIAAFEAELNEGDVVTIDGTKFTVTNETVTGEVNNVAKDDEAAPTTADFRIGPFGDVPTDGSDTQNPPDGPEAAGNDDVYRAGDEETEAFVVGGATSNAETFLAQLSDGDSVAYSRTDGVETFSLTNRSPSTITGEAQSIDPDGDGDGGLIDDSEDGGAMTIALEDGTTRTVSYAHDGQFVVDGLLSTEARFEEQFSAGDQIVFRPADPGTSQTQRIELTNQS